jgi:peptide chain release factor 2
MEIDNLKEKLQILSEQIEKINKAFNLDEKINELNKKEKLTYEPDFYNSNNSSDILQQIKNLSVSIKKYTDVKDMLQEVSTYIELYELEQDEECLKEAINILKKIEENKDKLEVETLLSDEYDSNNAILTIHPGAGRY